jgi:AcrR family transcriptional regulator
LPAYIVSKLKIEELGMARKSSRKSDAPPNPPSSDGKSTRERIVDAFMALLAQKPIEQIGYAAIAKEAGVSLPELRDTFGSTFAILAAHIKQIDRQVLAGADEDMAAEPPRERLFDTLMHRLEVLEPYKLAVRSLTRSAASNPGLAFALNGLAVRSQQWMLTAADIDAAGPRGLVRAQGLAVLFATVLRIWVNDDDPGHARTMAALDRALARGQRWSGFLDSMCRFRTRMGRPRRRMRDDPGDDTVAA